VKVLVVLPLDEALVTMKVLRAVRNVGEREPGDIPPGELWRITMAAGRISNAITRQTTPRSLVSHED
jgi:hypothetical protein